MTLIKFNFSYVYFAFKKKAVYFNEITQRTLHSWNEKTLQCHIHMWSMNVSSSTVYNEIRNVLIEPWKKDRAGAPSQMTINEAVEKLKTIHSHRYQGEFFIWHMWATSILNSAAHLREGLFHEVPPSRILQIFTEQSDSREHLRGVRTNVSVGAAVSEGLQEDFQQLQTLYERMQRRCDEYEREHRYDMREMKQRLLLIGSRLQGHTEVLSVVEHAVSESDYSRQLLEVIPNAEDTEHA